MAFGCQHLGQHVLGMVGVLVLVYQNIIEGVLVFGQHLRAFIEHADSYQQQIVKVHGVAAQQSFLVLRVHLGHLFFVKTGRRPGIRRRILQSVLGVADGAEHPCGLEAFLIQLQIF